MAKGQKTGGRKKGSLNKRTRETIARVEAEGIMPLDVMLLTMRGLWDAANAKPDNDAARTELRIAACEEAARAAPYVHARLIASENKTEHTHRYVTRAPAIATSEEAWERQYAPRPVVQ